VYSLRKGGYFNDLDPFIDQVEGQLDGKPLLTSLDRCLKPLRDVANSPICAVDLWMQSVIDVQGNQSASVIH
ncbi:hypothetical protein, partial [Saccharospirillum sp. MSK14-1]|uniref:hypothetical protein n=1 Tax=Saccharospirillum sp. MSK14-1 TaxID=1897632 RepID=UPI0013048B20